MNPDGSRGTPAAARCRAHGVSGRLATPWSQSHRGGEDAGDGSSLSPCIAAGQAPVANGLLRGWDGVW